MRRFLNVDDRIEFALDEFRDELRDGIECKVARLEWEIDKLENRVGDLEKEIEELNTKLEEK